MERQNNKGSKSEIIATIKEKHEDYYDIEPKFSCLIGAVLTLEWQIGAMMYEVSVIVDMFCEGDTLGDLIDMPEDIEWIAYGEYINLHPERLGDEERVFYTSMSATE